MSLMEHTGKHAKAVIGLGVVAVSLFGVIAPAAAAAPSRTTLSSSTPSIGVGSTAKLKAVVKQVTGTLQPTGTVTFREGTTATSPPVVGTSPVTLVTVNGVMTAKLDVTTLQAGNHTFIATYSGSTAFNASTSLTTNILVTAVAKTNTTTVGSTTTPLSVAPGADVKLKAVVKQAAGFTKPTGSVTFAENGVAIAPSVPLVLIGTTTGVMTAKLTITTLSVGIHQITATYSGSAAFNGSTSGIPPSTSAIPPISVGKITTASELLPTHVSTTDATRTVMSVQVTAADGSIPTGFVNFVLDGSAPQPYPLSAVGKAQFSRAFTPGSTHTVSAAYPGDAAYNGSTALPMTFTTPLTAP